MANYGASGQGLILLTSNDIGTVGAPAISIFSHAGSPWTTQTEHVRIGNLDGLFGITTDLYGFAAGDYGDENYISYDPTNGFLVSAGDGKVTIDADGILLGDGSASTPGAGSLRWDNSSRIYEYVIADDVSSGNDSITLSLYGRNDGMTSTDWGAVEIAAYRWVAGAGSSTRSASIDLYSFGGTATYEPRIRAAVQSGYSSAVYWELDTGALRVMGAELQVGATLGSSPSLGEGDLTVKDDLWVEGDYKKVINSTDYDVCFPYTATKDSLASNADIGTSWTTILTRTITVPAAARIKATVSGYWIDSSHSANGDLYFRIVIDGTTVAQVYQVSWQILTTGATLRCMDGRTARPGVEPSRCRRTSQTQASQQRVGQTTLRCTARSGMGTSGACLQLNGYAM